MGRGGLNLQLQHPLDEAFAGQVCEEHLKRCLESQYFTRSGVERHCDGVEVGLRVLALVGKDQNSHQSSRNSGERRDSHRPECDGCPGFRGPALDFIGKGNAQLSGLDTAKEN